MRGKYENENTTSASNLTVQHKQKQYEVLILNDLS